MALDSGTDSLQASANHGLDWRVQPAQLLVPPPPLTFTNGRGMACFDHVWSASPNLT